METEEREFLQTLKKKIKRLHTCKTHWKQFMIIRGVLILYNRFSLQFPYHTSILSVDTLVLHKCRVILDSTNNGFKTYMADQQRYLSKYFIPTTQQTIQNYYKRKKRLLFFLATKGLCDDLRRYAIEFVYR